MRTTKCNSIVSILLLTLGFCLSSCNGESGILKEASSAIERQDFATAKEKADVVYKNYQNLSTEDFAQLINIYNTLSENLKTNDTCDKLATCFDYANKKDSEGLKKAMGDHDYNTAWAGAKMVHDIEAKGMTVEQFNQALSGGSSNTDYDTPTE